jgi:hypothetical protein
MVDPSEAMSAIREEQPDADQQRQAEVFKLTALKDEERRLSLKGGEFTPVAASRKDVRYARFPTPDPLLPKLSLRLPQKADVSSSVANPLIYF